MDLQAEISPGTNPPAQKPASRSWRWLQTGCLLLILAVGGWLRLAHAQLIEFKADEADAAAMALRFAQTGDLPEIGLMSSVGVRNPPFFIDVLTPMFLVTPRVDQVTQIIAFLGLVAALIAWHIGRTYYGPVAGLIAAALFAVSPWAVLYSRKIWAQDLTPLFSSLTLWAMHALILGRRPRAILAAILFPLLSAQLHLSGVVLIGTVLVLLVVLRPKIDWRWATTGLALGILPLLPYLKFQSRNGWPDAHAVLAAVSGESSRRIAQISLTARPGAVLVPTRNPWAHILSLTNAGDLEALLGTSAEAFGGNLPITCRLLEAERWLMVACWAYLTWRMLPGIQPGRRWPFLSIRATESSQRAALLSLWMVLPPLIYQAAGLWTYPWYLLIVYPGPFLCLGAVAQELTERKRPLIALAVGGWMIGLAVPNFWLMDRLYRFLEVHGGAEGPYGTALVYKQQAAEYLVKHGFVGYPSPGSLWQMDRYGSWDHPQSDLPFLIAHQPVPRGLQPRLPAHEFIGIVDANRSHFQPRQSRELQRIAHVRFGPFWLFFVHAAHAEP